MQIHWQNPDAVRDADRERAEARIEALADGHRDLIDIWIDVRPSAHHRHGGDEVVLRCQARGTELVARRTADEPGAALTEVLRAFEREVHRMRERRAEHRPANRSGAAQVGVVDRIFPERGYGFLVTEGGEEVYFHRNALNHGLEFDALEEGRRVALNVEEGERGLQATVVMPAPPDVALP